MGREEMEHPCKPRGCRPQFGKHGREKPRDIEAHLCPPEASSSCSDHSSLSNRSKGTIQFHSNYFSIQIDPSFLRESCFLDDSRVVTPHIPSSTHTLMTDDEEAGIIKKSRLKERTKDLGQSLESEKRVQEQ